MLLTDGLINLFLGLVLLAWSGPVIRFFGLPATGQAFYPNILGAVLAGIGLALFLELRSRGSLHGLGLGGAICINLAGGLVLFCWLVWGGLEIPLRGKVILWVLDFILVVISSLEGISLLRKDRSA